MFPPRHANRQQQVRAADTHGHTSHGCRCFSPTGQPLRNDKGVDEGVGVLSGQPLRKTAWRLLRKVKAELKCNPAVPLLGVCPK